MLRASLSEKSGSSLQWSQVMQWMDVDLANGLQRCCSYAVDSVVITGGSRGGGVAGVATPLKFQKRGVTSVTVVKARCLQ